MFYKSILLILGAFFTVIADYRLNKFPTNLLNKLEVSHYSAYEALYLPNKDFINFISIGYKNVTARFFWLTTLNYFGKHYNTDKDYKWLVHRCNLLTELDPKNIGYYDFCSTLISWEVNKPQESILLLTKAIENYPKNWRFWYLRGFTYLYFLKDEQAAQEDLLVAASLPNVHPVVARLAAKKYEDLHGSESTIQLLEELIATSNEESVKMALREKLNKLLNKTEREK
jgi:hypothetical protein